MSERVVKVRLLAQVSEYEAGMLKAARATRSTGTELEKLEQKKQAFEQVGRGMMATGAALAGVTALSVKAAMDWESAWAGVTKTVEGTPEQMGRVEEGLRGLTSVLPASHEEIAAVAEAAGQLGIQTGNVVAFTKTMIDLGETTNLSASDAATSLARFVNIMGTSQSQVSNLGSALVGLGNNYATTEAEIMEMAMRLAGAGKQIGMTEGDVLGLATALSSVGIEAEAGGSAMSKVMIDIAASVENGDEKLAKFAATAGMTVDAFSQLWRTDSAAALSAFVKGLGSAESQGKSTLGILEDLGITEVRMRDALLRSSSAADQFAGAMQMGNREFEKNNALTDEAAKRYETVQSKISIAGNAIRDAAISMGEQFLPMVGSLAEGAADFAKFIGGLPDPVQGLIGLLTGTAGVIGLAGGAALLAIPKFAAFKVSMEVLTGTSFSVRGGLASLYRFMTGPLAIGIVGLTALLYTYNKTMSDGIPEQEAIRNKIATTADAAERLKSAVQDNKFFPQIDANTKKLLDDLPGLLDQAAEAQGNWFVGLMKSSTASDKAFESLDRYGQALATLSATDMPAAQAGFADMVETWGLTDKQALTLLDKMPALKDAFTRLATEQGIATDSSEFLELAMGNLTPPTDEAAAALDGAGDALDDVEREADEAERALDGAAKALDAVAGKAMQMGDSHDRALASLNALTEAAKAEGATLDGTNDASIRLRDSLRDVEQSHRDSAEAIIRNTGDLKAAQAEWEKGRQKVIEMRVAKGEDIATATRWADENLGSASEVKGALDGVYQQWLKLDEKEKAKLKIEVEKAQAEAALEELKQKLASIPNVKRIKLESYTVGSKTVDAGYNYQGGIYEQGVKHFARGGIESGIYAGVQGGIRNGDAVFAERDMGVPWETYISGRSADRGRNLGIWMQTGQMLGAFGQPRQPSQSVELPPVYVQNPFTGDYLLAQVSTVAEGAVAARGDRLSADLRSRRRADA
ncbi:phage tail tape measure protein [Microbacterium sp. 69-10]|uniref:phage tail tape measure protein n=1 Tax=Microbacterium sp. 69-10 TaxID=1895783 RepID=UPI000AD786C7|nr:phage tail tape measure protein [Microbacterium sp. 69-10]